MKNDVALSIRKRRNVIFVCVSIIIGLCVAFALMTTAYLLTDMRAADNKARLNDYYFEALNELSDEDRNAFMADVARVTRAMQKAFQPEKINYGAYSDKLSHLHFHLAPKYVDGPDYGGVFQMNPGKVYLTDTEYQELIDAVKANL